MLGGRFGVAADANGRRALRLTDFRGLLIFLPPRQYCALVGIGLFSRPDTANPLNPLVRFIAAATLSTFALDGDGATGAVSDGHAAALGPAADDVRRAAARHRPRLPRRR